MSSSRSCCTFTVGGRWFGLPVDRVREVIRHPALTPVPLAPPEVAGLMNLRGEVVLVVDLRVRLGIAPARPDRPPVDLLLRGKEGVISLMADQIGPVLETREEDFEPIPETVAPAARRLLSGAYKLSDRLLLVLDPDRAAELAVREAAPGKG